MIKIENSLAKPGVVKGNREEQSHGAQGYTFELEFHS